MELAVPTFTVEIPKIGAIPTQGFQLHWTSLPLLDFHFSGTPTTCHLISPIPGVQAQPTQLQAYLQLLAQLLPTMDLEGLVAWTTYL